MLTTRSLPVLALALAGLGSLASARPLGDACPADSYCYLPRWIPTGANGGETYGQQVEIDGDTAAVSGENGAPVAIYERIGSTWIETQLLPNPSGLIDDEYGRALTLDGDRLAVGAPKDDTFTFQNGAVHLFERKDGTWSYVQTLYDITPDSSERFGYHVDLDGPWLGVSTYGNSDQNNVRAYLELGGGWVHYAQVGLYETGPGGTPFVVRSLDGGQIVQFFVGSPSSNQQAVNGGRAEFVSLSAAGIHSQPVPAPPLDESDRFGFSVALDGETLVLGAPSDDDAGLSAGAAYLYEVGADPIAPSLTLVDKLFPCGDVEGAFFGGSVDVRGERIAVGAATQDTTIAETGAAYVFGPSGFGDWIIYDRIVAEDATSFSLFGGQVALAENAILVGAQFASGPGPHSGAAYLVSTNPDSISGGECPCTALASHVPYGEGKAGSAGIPLLSASGAPVPGESILVKLADVLVGGTPFLFHATLPAAIPFDGGTFLVGGAGFTVMPTVTAFGQVGLQWQVPANPALCGESVYAQALLLDPVAGGAYSTAQSNGLQLTVGY